MKLNLNNEIDNKIFSLYKQETLKMLSTDKVDYFGINISSDKKSDYKFKIYYQDEYSRFLYENSKNKNPLLEFLFENDMMRFLTAIHDKNEDFNLYDAGVGNRTNENMEKFFEYMDKNIKIFTQNKDEILKISKMKSTPKENHDYHSLYFMAYMNNVLKCHWFNNTRKNIISNEYYLDFIENLQIKEFCIISNIIKKIISFSGGRLLMEGIDYTENGPQKYKIYIRNSKSNRTVDVLLKVIDNPILKDKIQKIKEWHNSHKYFYCDGFALCLDKNNIYTINFYFRNKNVFYPI